MTYENVLGPGQQQETFIPKRTRKGVERNLGTKEAWTYERKFHAIKTYLFRMIFVNYYSERL